MRDSYHTSCSRTVGALGLLAFCMLFVLPMSTARAVNYHINQWDHINLSSDFTFDGASPLYHTGDYVHHGMTTTSWAASRVGGDTFLRAKQSGKNSSTSITTWIRFDDLIFTGPGTSVTVTPNFFVAGSVNVPSNTSGFGAVMLMRTRVGGNPLLYVGIYVHPACCGATPYGAIGAITDPSFSGVFAGPTFSVPVGVAVQMYVEMKVQVLSGGQNGVGVDSFIDFGSSEILKATTRGPGVGFPLDSKVFTLPEGYTVNSMEARIIDNNWVPGFISIREDSWGQIKSLFR